MAKIYIGIGGWSFDPWRETFYPPEVSKKRELEYASRQLTSIEINSTYYGSQKPETYAKWRDDTPEGFVFAVKASRFATNRKILSEAAESVEKFLTHGIVGMEDRLGPINWQFMATKKFDPADFEGFLKLLPKSVDGHKLRHALEVRSETFCTPDFIAMARAYDVAIVTVDAEFPQIADITSDFAYLRLMGTREDTPLGYTDAELEAWAERIIKLHRGEMPNDLKTYGPQTASGLRDVFAYVISGHKDVNPLTAMALIEKINKRMA
jgi:uncharacterized protein YecE (DUF72 family)